MSGPVDSRPSPNDSGDAWVFAPDGRQFWGTFGAAGLLAHDRARGVLLQHRVEWSHFGGTWTLPGGARHREETAVQAAFREAAEEAGVPEAAVRPRFSAVTDLGFWSYTTVIADVLEPFEPVISDPESLELRWVPVAEVETLPLHPGFEASWPALRAELERSETLVIDAANVIGARPDGWWKDRRAAAERLLAAAAELCIAGVPARALGLGQDHWWPRVRVVLEGGARGASLPDPLPAGLSVVEAPGEGDPAIIAEVDSLGHDAPVQTVWTVTSDRELQERVASLGSRVLGARWFWERLDERGAEE